MRFLLSILLLLIYSAAHGEESDSYKGSIADVTIQKPSQEPSSSEDKHETLDSFINLYQPYLTNISAYQPIYFLAGTDLAKSKFQFSFKYRFLKPDGPLAQKHPWVKGFHFGYTQTSFWDLKSDSLPFEDTSYKPELFHVTRNFTTRPAWLEGFFLMSGLEHESNGRSEEFSRSINYLYLRPVFIFYNNESKLGLGIYPKIWTYIASGDENKDIDNYRGYFQLETKFGKADGFLFGACFRWAKEGGSARLDISYPLGRSLLEDVNVYLHVQYASTLAESLINYQERTEAVRIGLSFIR